MNRNILPIYYAATVLFLSLDFGFGINIRAAFLEHTPGLRAAYYAVLFACFMLIAWRPAWATAIGGLESLATLTALIVNMALRSMIVTDAMLETGAGIVNAQEVVNFMIVGGAAYISWYQGMHAISKKLRG
ncbi:MAG: hypothetical protein OEM25_01115 [Gammaproteobacteria bacterium]|nr:hypothetical protein [Gammaproteobacteria bacterium]